MVQGLARGEIRGLGWQQFLPPKGKSPSSWGALSTPREPNHHPLLPRRDSRRKSSDRGHVGRLVWPGPPLSVGSRYAPQFCRQRRAPGWGLSKKMQDLLGSQGSNSGFCVLSVPPYPWHLVSVGGAHIYVPITKRGVSSPVPHPVGRDVGPEGLSRQSQREPENRSGHPKVKPLSGAHAWWCLGAVSDKGPQLEGVNPSSLLHCHSLVFSPP